MLRWSLPANNSKESNDQSVLYNNKLHRQRQGTVIRSSTDSWSWWAKLLHARCFAIQYQEVFIEFPSTSSCFLAHTGTALHLRSSAGYSFQIAASHHSIHNMMLQSRCSQCVTRMRQQSVNQSRPLTHTSSRQLVVARMGSSSSSRSAAAEQQLRAAKSQVQRFLEPSTFMASFGLYLLAEAPAALADEGSPFQGMTANSLYVTLGLFLLTVPGKQIDPGCRYHRHAAEYRCVLAAAVLLQLCRTCVCMAHAVCHAVGLPAYHFASDSLSACA
jgi:hypothetical protein